MENDLEAFLWGRDVSPVIIQRMKKDKIDKSVLSMLTDEQLAQYIPAYGDRVAVASFCRQHSGGQSAEKEAFLARVSAKIGARKRTANTSHSGDLSQAPRPQTAFLPKQKPKKKAIERPHRRVNLGWLHYRPIEGYKQVRLDCGGGSRSVTIERYAAYEDLIEKGKELFFPDGLSPKGAIEDFIFELCDFKRDPVNKMETVQDMYEKTGLHLLRLYICTKERYSLSDEEEPANLDRTDEDTENPSKVYNTRAKQTISVISDSDNESSGENASPQSSPSHSQHSTAPRSSTNAPMHAEEWQRLQNAYPLSLPSHSQHSTAPRSSTNAPMHSEEGLQNAYPLSLPSHSQHSTAPRSSTNAPMHAEEGLQNAYPLSLPSHSQHSTAPRSSTNAPMHSEEGLQNAYPLSLPSHSQHSTAPRSSTNAPMHSEEGLQNASPQSSPSHSQHSTPPRSSQNNAAMRAEDSHGLENAYPLSLPSHSQHSTAPRSSTNAPMHAEEWQGLQPESQMHAPPEPASQPTTERRVRIVAIHRQRVVEYLLDAFKDSSILNCKLKMIFVTEKAIDSDGVSRDVYTAFWEQFLELCEGEDERVPRLRPDYSEIEWVAVGRIWVKGLLDHGVLPVKLSKAFIIACIHGLDSVPNKVLLTSFLQYISSSERSALQKALQGDVDESDEEDLLDLFTRMGSYKLPSKDDLEASIQTMAHKAIIQEPKFILDCFSQAIASSEMTLSDKDGVLGLYEKKRANGKRVAQLLEPMAPMNQRESEVFNHLQRFIKSADQGKAEKILRFCTGANVICVEKINVSFNAESGLGRRLVAHTCGPLLEVPYTYLSYPEFRVEFDNILSNNYLEMDIL